jgi:hypothetical protein
MSKGLPGNLETVTWFLWGQRFGAAAELSLGVVGDK